MVAALDHTSVADLLTMREAAALAGVHRNTIRAWCTSGRLASVRVNERGERRLRRADLEDLVAARRSRHGEPASEAGAGEASPAASPAFDDGHLRLVRRQVTRGDALRRIAADISSRSDLDKLFEDVIDDAFALFGVDQAGLWLYEPTAFPLTLASQRGLGDDIVAQVSALPRSADTAGMRAIRERRVVVLADDLEGTAPDLRSLYLRNRIRTICFVPIVFRDEPLGLLVLYHQRPYDWSDDERGLVRSFADAMAAAIGNARLYDSVQSLAARLDAIHELALRLNRIQNTEQIGEAIIAEARALIEFDTIRVYRVDREAGMCEPIAFRGTPVGGDQPLPELLRVPIGTGLTGWVAAHNETVRLGDAQQDARGVVVEMESEPESMLLVPMSFDDVVHGVIVVSQLGRDRFTEDDERTLSIFAGYAAQALVNARQLEEVERHRADLQHQLASQRRLLEVNERLLSTLDPQGVLELIADSLMTVVSYDSLAIYRIDRERAVRRVVVARDRFADVILDYEGPVNEGLTGWVINRGEAVLANDAHADPRTIQIPGTPFEPESMIVVPLIVHREVIGTLNIGRVGADARFSPNEFELTKLFAGQASIALQNAEAHGAIKVRAEHDALTGLRNHGTFQRELGVALAAGRPFTLLMMDLDGFKAFNDARGHPAGDALLADIGRAMATTIRDGDALYRYGGDEFAVLLAGASRTIGFEVAERLRRAVATLPAAVAGPPVTVSVGVACYPDDGTTKDELVGAADAALYLAKPSGQRDAAVAPRDPYVIALDETAIALMDRLEPTELLETIVARAAALLGTPHAYIYLAEEGTEDLVVRVGLGAFADLIGFRLPIDRGLAGNVFRTGRPVVVDDYDAWSGRAPNLPGGPYGAVVGVPLTQGATVVGVLGLASGQVERRFTPREIAALGRFAQLASIALDNARLFEAAQRGALYDRVTGLPNRELLVDRIGHALGVEGAPPVGVILLDLDRFQVINESLGHAVGDRLLVAVGQRLASCLRPSDTVARFGSDEFGLVLDPVDGEEEASRTARRILTELRMPFELGGREWFIGASLGVAVGHPRQTTPEELLREAEIALYRAKSDSVRRVTLFDPSMGDDTLARVDLETDLRRAIDRGELRVHYQPIVDLATDDVTGVEALVRWQHPSRGLVPPAAFIPVAEETGLIVPLGELVLETACRQARTWRTLFPDRRLTTSVNLSARQFGQPDLVEQVARVLEATGTAPESLELEITESVLMDESEAGIRQLRALRELGVRLVLDDFGTGYSSLSYLKHLPLDTIKIDRSFITGLEEADANLPIVQAVIALAHGLGIEVVAEGIESLDQANRLRELGCDRGQGYGYAAPMPKAEVTALLRRTDRLRRTSRSRRAPAEA